MPDEHTRPPPQGPLDELIALRLRKYPDMLQKDFAEQILGITRLHMSSIEVGRRRPSAELVLKWLAALGPEARLSMFGSLPTIEARIALLQRVQSAAPEAFKAA
jgi:DNA-binding XRE family transcriptional regulator